MSWIFTSSFLLPILAIWLYFNGRTAYNALVLAPLPASYFARGDSAQCKVIRHTSSDALKFCEDLTTWRTRDAAGNVVERVIASCDRGRYEWNTVMGPLHNPDPKGALWLILPDVGGAEPLTLENFNSTHDFHPIGLDIFPGDSGEPSTLYVVNHMRERLTVEVFALHDENPPRLVHLKQLYHPMFWAANSVAALSHKEFYLSIDHWFRRSGLAPWRWFAPQLETALVLPLGLVEYVQFGKHGINFVISVFGMPFPNGLSLSPDKSKLAVSSTSAGKVRIYDVERNGGALTYNTSILVPFSPDNLHYQDDGSLLVAGHQHFPSITRLARQRQTASPSWVVSISDRTSNTTEDRNAPYSVYNRVPSHRDYSMETIYQSNGTGWSASTTALWTGKNKDKFLMSGLYTEGILVC